MIVDLFVGAILGVVNVLLSLIPSWQLPAATADPTALGAMRFLGILNGFLPVPDLLLVLGVAFAWSMAVAIWNVVMWAYDKIPFKAS